MQMEPSAHDASQTGAVPVEPSATGAASSSGDSKEVVSASAGSDLLAHIDRLKAEKKRQKAERQTLAKNLKNAERRKSRLKKRARQLSDADLQDVIRLRSALAAQQASTSKAEAVQKT